MQYGLARNIDIYHFENQTAERIIATPGDNIQAQLWANKYLEDLPEASRMVCEVFVWAWMAFKRLQKLEEYGLDAKLTRDELFRMMDLMTIQFSDIEEDALPLASDKRPKK